jgi:hypothetical protein
MAGFAILTFHAVDKGGGFSVEAMQTIGLLVKKSIIFWNKLPSDF